MRIIYSDLKWIKRGFIVQQYDCVTKKEEGLPLSIERAFPYCTIYSDEQKRVPGTYKIYSNPPHPDIVCLLAQVYPGVASTDDDTPEQRLKWFVQALSDFLRNVWSEKRNKPVCIPYQIGCGLDGGDWKRYERALEELEHQFDVEFQVYKGV